MKTSMKMDSVRQTTRRAIRIASEALFGLLAFVLLMGTSVPAQAAQIILPTSVKQDITINSFIGCANLAFLAPAAPTSAKITGWVIGAIVIVAFIGMVIAGFRMITAGKHVEKAQEGIASIRSALVGLGWVLIGIPVLGTLVAAIMTAFCTT